MQHKPLVWTDLFCPHCHTEYDEQHYSKPALKNLPGVATVRCMNATCVNFGRVHYIPVSPEPKAVTE